VPNDGHARHENTFRHVACLKAKPSEPKVSEIEKWQGTGSRKSRHALT